MILWVSSAAADDNVAIPKTAAEWKKYLACKGQQQVSPNAAYKDGICRGQACSCKNTTSTDDQSKKDSNVSDSANTSNQPVAQTDGTLDYDQLSRYLQSKYRNCQVSDKSSDNKDTVCYIYGDRPGYSPSAKVEVSLGGGDVSYSLDIKEQDLFGITRSFSPYQEFFNDTLAKADIKGTKVGSVTPTLQSLYDLCVKKSEINTSSGDCRAIMDITGGYGAKMWGESGSSYYGYSFTIQFSRKM